jgi:hypothetical protein
MEATQNQKTRHLSFHWTAGSTAGLLMIIQCVLCLIVMPAFLAHADPEFVGYVPLLIFQALFGVFGLILFIDATFVSVNSSRIGVIVSTLVLAVVYVICLLVFAVITRNERLAYIDANPGDFTSEAAIATARSNAYSLCTKQLIFFSIALPCLIALIPFTIIKALDGEARTPFYVSFGLSLGLLFLGMYLSINVLDTLSDFSAMDFAKIVETRSIVAYVACIGVTSLKSDFDPDIGKAPAKDF